MGLSSFRPDLYPWVSTPRTLLDGSTIETQTHPRWSPEHLVYVYRSVEEPPAGVEPTWYVVAGPQQRLVPLDEVAAVAAARSRTVAAVARSWTGAQ